MAKNTVDLQGGVAIVTGSARGLGAATAKLLASKGCNVVVNHTKSEDQAEAVAADCRAAGAEAIVCQADVSEDADCRRMAQAAMDKWGRIDGLVNNAGTTKFCAHDNLEGLSAEDFHYVLGVNTIGPFQMVRAVAPHMQAQGHGSVVNVSSVAGIQAIGSSLAYIASKGGLNTMTIAMARALGPDIKVNAICPGFIEGDWLRQGMGAERYDATKAHLESATPLRAVNAPEDLAETVVFLLSNAPNITGEIITVDAGMGLLRGGVRV
jgi:3-oxoacyl-[acyl-carrier protein] reductase